MGFDDGQIILDSENGAYYAGQTVYGRIVFDQGKPKTIHGIYVSCKGFCKVHWTTSHQRRVNDRTVYDTIVHESYEEYFNRKFYVIGNENGEHHLQQGTHEFRFDCPIPNNCPSTFEGSNGHIRYRVKAVMVTSGIFSSNKEKMAPIKVHAPLDLNQNPYCKEPIEYELINSYCCWCMSAGSSEIRVKLPVGGYCSGQIIPIEVNVSNLSSVKIDELKFAIKRDIKFEAMSRPGTRYDHDTVAEIKKGPIPGGTTRNWTLEMEVPAMDIYNVNACRFIDIDYYFKVSAEASGCHDNAEESHAIIFGTVPLVGFQDNIQNPLQDQLPKQMDALNVQGGINYPPPPIINQPLPNSPYPNGGYPQNTPYPGGAPSPGPIVTLYTGPNVTPLPTSPYPGNQPFPNVSPYPNSTSPFPNTASPYPPANPPYPTSTPYSPGNLPHSTPNLGPSIPGRSPSPVPPYPGNNPVPRYGSNPNVASAGLLKTGTFGFSVQGSGDTAIAPLLPPGASVPYPTRSPLNPYATASAPEPSTPGSEKNDAPEVISPYPAYNPDFVNSDKKDDKVN